MISERKFCPLLSINADKGCVVSCEGERCMWYIVHTNECVITYLEAVYKMLLEISLKR